MKPQVTLMIIRTQPRKPRRKIGDRKLIKGVWHVCRQEYSERDKAYVSNNGRPCLEWVPE